VRIGQAKVLDTHEVKVVMADVEYQPLDSLDAALALLQVSTCRQATYSRVQDWLMRSASNTLSHGIAHFAMGHRLHMWVQEFVQLLCGSLPESIGRLQEVTPQFAEYMLPEAFSAQHAALQYIAALSVS